MQRFLAALCVAAAAGAMAEPAQPARFDVLIRNARVMDGTGNPWLRADLGFMDVHSHAGDGIRNPALHQGQPLIAQGVTTFIANPDGGGPVDLAAERVAIEAARTGPNVGLLIGHGSVRSAVMGNANRAPTADELQKMKDLVRRGMAEGLA